VNLSKPFACPVCQQRKPWGDLVKHVAYADDYEHEQLRVNHGFPRKIPFGTAGKLEPWLRLMIIKESPQ
jgi:hypothetical protein